MDTEYTKGFKAGVAFREEQIIKMLEKEYMAFVNVNRWADSNYFMKAIALIKGEK